MTNFKAHINKTLIDRLLPGDYVTDISLRGFSARRQKHCVSYLVKVSINNKPKLFTIGKHGLPWTPETARRKAMEIKSDPSAAIKNDEKLPTISEAVETFKKDHLSNLKVGPKRDYSSLLDKHIIPILGKILVKDANKQDFIRLHKLMASTPRWANYALTVLSTLMNWCEDLGYRPINSNPCAGIKRYKENKRERYLSEKEFTYLGLALHKLQLSGKISIYAAAAIRLLIFTGARTTEILSLKHSSISYDKKMLFLSDSKTGQKTIKLNGAAIDILKSLPRHLNSDYVIVGQRAGKHMVNLSKPWKAIKEEAKIENCRIHDLRHSYASILASKGASLLLIGKLLGHTNPSTTARYAHLADDIITTANNTVGHTLSNLMNPTSSDNSK